MTRDELARRLKEMYTNAKEGEKAVNIHLFGIMYGEYILNHGYKPKDIVQASGLNISYAAEVNKGVNLSKYVAVKNKDKQ
ncbi:HTH-like domain-containing protein [Planococcus salinarum]|uniref:HTH-like domain-containing protein n=1 Tax=Planococcus salinarum TaxID=622695 RepID=UPI000E3CE19C|nr:hypothetical protein [Planococcus salinarum]TAA72444.1 hypothetical protein D2909_06725 [Planococcus salinarum]